MIKVCMFIMTCRMKVGVGILELGMLAKLDGYTKMSKTKNHHAKNNRQHTYRVHLSLLSQLHIILDKQVAWCYKWTSVARHNKPERGCW